MAEKKQGIDWSTVWKKEDWISVWIGFLILILLMVGATFRLPGWKWMTDGAFSGKISGWSKTADALAKDGETKGEEVLKTGAAALKTAFDARKSKGR